jgi:antitoxin component HigA of HigAB toxin-antitoxin module
MHLDNLQDAKFSDICAKFPLKPIEDDGSYRAAIEILDRLFALDDPRTPAELEYFQMLAKLAYKYEMSTNTNKSSAPIDHRR